jgi:hypothetical protein
MPFHILFLVMFICILTSSSIALPENAILVDTTLGSLPSLHLPHYLQLVENLTRGCQWYHFAHVCNGSYTIGLQNDIIFGVEPTFSSTTIECNIHTNLVLNSPTANLEWTSNTQTKILINVDSHNYYVINYYHHTYSIYSYSNHQQSAHLSIYKTNIPGAKFQIEGITSNLIITMPNMIKIYNQNLTLVQEHLLIPNFLVFYQYDLKITTNIFKINTKFPLYPHTLVHDLGGNIEFIIDNRLEDLQIERNITYSSMFNNYHHNDILYVKKLKN